MSQRHPALPAADEELWALVEAVIAGTATADDRARLEVRLRTEEAARIFYVAFLDLHAYLQWRMRGATAPTAGKITALSRGKRFLSRPLMPAAASVFLAVTLGMLAALVVQRPTADDADSPDLAGAPAESVAVLIGHQDIVWDEGTTLPTEPGSPLPPGRLKLRSGVVEIAFRGGGDVLLEGPADFDVNAPDRAFLHRGKMTAKVSEGAPALEVRMPGLMVTDRGGECGLLRDESGLTELHVFDGQIGAEPIDEQGEPLPGMRLAGNTGARVDISRQTFTPVPLNERAFAHLRPEVRVTDASVRGGQFSQRNFGTTPQLMVKNTIPDYCWETYLRLDLSGIRGKVSEARVRLVPVKVGQPLENAVAVAVDDQWNETTITWDQRPSSGPPFARWTVEEGKPVEFDVTAFVQSALSGAKVLSLRIFAPEYRRGPSFVQYGSRKGNPEARPQLLITMAP